MKRGRIFLAIIAVCALFTVSTASAQEQGEIKAGAKMAVYSGWNGTFGIGAYARYGLTDDLRLEPSLLYLCRKGMSVDFSIDAQYAFDISDSFEAYPAVGIALNDPAKFGLGINFGGGASYKLSDVVDIDFGVKWVLQTQSYISNPLVFSLGGSYKF